MIRPMSEVLVYSEAFWITCDEKKLYPNKVTAKKVTLIL